MTYVLDASALLRFTDNEAGSDRVLALLQAAAQGEADLLMSAVNWSEVVAVLDRRLGRGAARTLVGSLASLPIAIAPVDAGAAEQAALFRNDYSLPYVDAYAGALTLAHSAGPVRERATLVTADYDFKNVTSGAIKIEFLAVK
jgi:predicted nucleic acid-binding protein